MIYLMRRRRRRKTKIDGLLIEDRLMRLQQRKNTSQSNS
jgi:hypothetical protein